MFTSRKIYCCIIALAFVAAAGCDTGPEKNPTTLLVGKAHCNGKPIPDGWILFIPLDGQGNSVEAKIADGNYRAPNVPLGRVQAVISALQRGERLPSSTEEEVHYKKINMVPKEYREGITATIKEGQVTWDFDMHGDTE